MHIQQTGPRFLMWPQSDCRKSGTYCLISGETLGWSLDKEDTERGSRGLKRAVASQYGIGISGQGQGSHRIDDGFGADI